MRTVAFCEVESFCRQVLAQHWPGVPIYGDVRELSGERLRADGIAVDVICGGFPCQDISLANNSGAGLAGEQSGLWREYARLIREIRPRYAIVENVPILRSRGLGDLLGDLASSGYDAEWQCIPACAVGAPHIRDRIWILAYPDCDGEPDGAEHAEASGSQAAMVNASSRRYRAPKAPVLARWSATELSSWWAAEPGLDRVAYGLPAQVDRLASLGNAVLPQIPELIGRAIMSRENGSTGDGELPE